MLHANVVLVCFIEHELLSIEVLHYGNMHFRPFWLLWPCPRETRWPTYPDPYPLEIYRMRENERPTSRLSKVIVWHTHWHTDKLRVVTSGHVTEMAVNHWIRIPENPMAHANLMALSVIVEQDLWAIEVYIAGMCPADGRLRSFRSVTSDCLSQYASIVSQLDCILRFFTSWFLDSIIIWAD